MHYLEALDQMTSLFEATSNTPMASGIKIINLAAMNMRYEKVALDRNLSVHPYILTRQIIESQLIAFKTFMEMNFIENPANLKPLSGKQTAMEAKHQALFNLIWDRYDSNDYETYVDRYKHRIIVNDLISIIEDKKCLDMGCGNGNFCFALVDLGARMAAGIDFGEDSIQYANSKRMHRSNGERCEFKVTTVYETGYSDNSFDFVIQNGVFHHLDDEYKAIIEARRVLKLNGFMWYYTDGEGGISYDLWDRSVFLLREIPQEYIRSILQTFNISTNKLVHLMDGMNATYRHTSWDKILQVLMKAGFGNFRRLSGGFETDTDPEIVIGDPYAKEKFGEGDLRILAQLVKK